MKNLTGFAARRNGIFVALAWASSYSQARMVLTGAKVAYDELEDCDYAPKPRASVEYQPGLDRFHLVARSPREVSAPGMKAAVEALLLAGYTTGNVLLVQSFVVADPGTVFGAFQVVKNKIALALDQAGLRPHLHAYPPGVELAREA